MAFCPKCGSNVPDGTQFCPACGAQVGANPNPAPNPPQQPYAQQPPYGQPAPNPSYAAAQAGRPGNISFGQRNIAVAIILSIVTCGIYGIYWLIKIADEINEASGDQNGTSGAMVFLLSIVTCGIYMFYWLYKAGEKLNTAKTMRGLPADSSAGIIYLVLAIFGLSIVSYALIQSELNKIAAFHGAPAA